MSVDIEDSAALDRTFRRSMLSLLPIAGAAGLACAWQAVVLAAHTFHVPPAHPPSGVTGFIVTHDYSKRQELVLYAFALVSVAVCVTGAVCEWRWYARKILHCGISSACAAWISGLTMTVPVCTTLATLPGGTFFVSRALLGISLCTTFGLQLLIAFFLHRIFERSKQRQTTTADDGTLHREPSRENA